MDTKIIEKWTYCNCLQCWNCKNCTDQYEELLSTAIKYSPLRNLNLRKEDILGRVIILPYCKVMDEKMTHVYDMPCPKFEAKEN